MTKLNDVERLTLLNQFKILKNQTGSEDYELGIKVLEEGLESFYNKYVFGELKDVIDETKCAFVLNVLSLYNDVIGSYKSLSNNEKTEDLEYKTKFHGFDFSDSEQIDYMKCADFYLYSEGQYHQIKEQIEKRNDSINSHGFGPTMDELSKYVSKRAEVRERKSHLDLLSKEELEYILD